METELSLCMDFLVASLIMTTDQRSKCLSKYVSSLYSIY